MPDKALAVMAFDYGLRRIGVAVGNTLSGTAEALATLPANDGEPDWRLIDKTLAEWRPALAVVGIPLGMDDRRSTLTGRAEAFAAELGRRYGIEVVSVDERLSSREAEDTLRERRRAGTLRRRVAKGDIDREAARVLLAQWLEHQQTGRPD